MKKNDLVDGQRVTAFQMVTGYRDHSIILISIFLLFALYTGFNRMGVLPGIYSDEYPKAYFRLVDDASSGKEKPLELGAIQALWDTRRSCTDDALPRQ